MQLLLQDFLLTHSLDELNALHGVSGRIHKHKASFNYSQIDSKENDILAQQARGCVISTKDGSPFPATGIVGETIALAIPFFRFFNLGQGCAVNVNWDDKDLVIWTKADGTLIICYFDPFTNEWCIATRGVSEGDVCLDSFEDLTFSKLFKKALTEVITKNMLGGTIPDFLQEKMDLVNSEKFWNLFCEKQLNKNFTYMFELCTPNNIVTVRHEQMDIWFLGVRKLVTGEEFNPEEYVSRIHWVPEFLIPNVPLLHKGPLDIETCWKIVNEKNGATFEGVVACDSNNNRVKMKNSTWLALNKLTDNIKSSPRHIAAAIINEKLDDIFSLLSPMLQERCKKIENGIHSLCQKHDEFFLENFKPGMDRKTFALLCQANPEIFMGYAMECYSKGIHKNFSSWLQTKKAINGEYPDSLTDKILETCKN